MTFKNKFQAIFFGLLTFFGLSLIGWGVALAGGAWQSFLIAIGGTFFGVGVAGIATSIEALNHWLHLQEIFGRLVEAKLLSNEADIRPHRRQMHHYYVTTKDNALIWRYELIDFAQPNLPGVLMSYTHYKGRDGESILARADAFATRERFVMLVHDLTNSEPPDVCVYPSFMKPGLDMKCGYELRETLDHRDTFCPSILTPEPVESWTTIGTVDAKVARVLTKRWSAYSGRVRLVAASNDKLGFVSGDA